MIDLKTGKHFNGSNNGSFNGSQMTRGGFLKGILASGIAPSITLATIANAESANATVGGAARGMMRMTGARNATVFGGGWTNPYITDGLVAMWDGEWNGRNGIHDPTTKIWYDLVGSNHTEQIPDDIIDARSYFSNNAFIIESDFEGWGRDVYFAKVKVNSELADVINSRVLTCQVVIRKGNNGPGSLPRMCCALGWTNGNYGLYGSPFTSTGNLNPNIGRGVIYTISHVFNEDVLYPYRDVTLTGLNTVSPRSSSIVAGDNFSLLYRDAYTLYKQELFCCRIYNRALSADEIRHNYLVDKARFNIP